MNTERTDETLNHLPSFISAFSFLVEQLDEIQSNFLNTVEQISVTMLFHFPRMSDNVKQACSINFKKLLRVLYEKKGFALYELLWPKIGISLLLKFFFF